MTHTTTRLKSRTVFCLLAASLGCLGIHNFYSGRIARGLEQMAITVLSCGFLSPAVMLWGMIEILFTRTDARGRPLAPLRPGLIPLLALIALFATAGWFSASLYVIIHNIYHPFLNIRCASNIKQTGNALIIYADDHQGWFPSEIEWAKMVEASESANYYMYCPFHPDDPGGYRYFGEGIKYSEVKNIHTTPLAADRSDRRHGGCLHIVFVDGHVERLSPDRYRARFEAADGSSAERP